jgi:hypothetical protein
MIRHTTDSSVTPLLLTERQAAQAMQISARKLWGLRQSGKIRWVREGRLVRYAPEDLRDYIEKQKVGPIPSRN